MTLNKIIYMFLLILILSIILFTANERIYFYKKYGEPNNKENEKITTNMYIIKYISLIILFISLTYSFFFIIHTNKYLKKKLGIFD